ncbi:hypothetical protein HY251_18440 [bacterium]|nr:hypothetical protein [bacterium]
MDGGAVAPNVDGSFTSIWFRQSEVFVAVPGKPERLLGSGCQCWLASGPGGAYAVWLDRKGGDVHALWPALKNGAKTIGSNAQDPSVAGSLDGKGPVFAAWATDDGVEGVALAARK